MAFVITHDIKPRQVGVKIGFPTGLAGRLPLSRLTAARATNLYDVMDAAYCSKELHADSRSLGHVPLIDHNPRSGDKDFFEPADAVRYRERSVAERTNARLKDEFGGRMIMVKRARQGHVPFDVRPAGLECRPVNTAAAMSISMNSSSSKAAPARPARPRHAQPGFRP